MATKSNTSGFDPSRTVRSLERNVSNEPESRLFSDIAKSTRLTQLGHGCPPGSHPRPFRSATVIPLSKIFCQAWAEQGHVADEHEEDEARQLSL